MERTEHLLMAIFGWRTIQAAERYPRAARRKKMAGDAMPLLKDDQRMNKSLPPQAPVAFPPHLSI